MATTTRTSALTLALLYITLLLASSSPSFALSPSNAKVTRRNFVEGAIAGAIGTSLVLPGVANADITNKVASPAALRKLKRAQKQLEGLQTDVDSNDFVAVKGFFRQPPFDEVRKNARILVIGGEDGPKATELDSAYKSFVATMEKIDGTASLGIRGRNIDVFRLKEEYDAMKSSMQNFVEVAEAAAEIPVQYAD